VPVEVLEDRKAEPNHPFMALRRGWLHCRWNGAKHVPYPADQEIVFVAKVRAAECRTMPVVSGVTFVFIVVTSRRAHRWAPNPVPGFVAYGVGGLSRIGRDYSGRDQTSWFARSARDADPSSISASTLTVGGLTAAVLRDRRRLERRLSVLVIHACPRSDVSEEQAAREGAS
jgi:hypothetical protein